MPRTPSTRGALRTLITGLVALLLAAGLGLTRPDPAAAAVTQLHGYRATVLGWTSWYGSYGMGPVGPAFCIDHGIRAPDPAYAYVPADLSSVPAATRSAMGWVAGAHGHGHDRLRHAAVMLVLHDLMGARYPQGRIDVDRLTTTQLAGFGGAEAAIIELARAMKAEGLARSHLRGTLRLSATLTGRAGDGTTTLTVSVRDADGRAVPGIAVALQATGASLSARSLVTGQDGRAQLRIRPGSGALSVLATATVPRPQLVAFAPTARPAQRVAQPARDALRSTASLGPAPTTTTTVPPTTTTTIPPTTTTTIPPTTTTTLPTTTTTLPPSTTTSTTAPPPPAPPPSPPATVAAGPPVPALPRTGVDTLTLGLYGLGLLLVGQAAVDLGRSRRRER